VLLVDHRGDVDRVTWALWSRPARGRLIAHQYRSKPTSTHVGVSDVVPLDATTAASLVELGTEATRPI
jgi:hypothetical protein